VSGTATDRETDVCLVGLGAVGGMAAYALTAAGRTVVALEAGPSRTGDEYIMDEIESTMGRNPWGATKFNRELPTWRRSPRASREPTRYTQRMANGVGGSSLAYATHSLRLHPDDFQIRSNVLARYGEKVLPPGSDITDWPLTYDDLEPYYDLAEELLGVSGQAGNVGGTLVPGGNPFEGSRRRPYPLAPLRGSGFGDLFAGAAAAAGYHPFHIPSAILSAPYRGRSACTYCSFCSRQGCHVAAKGSTFHTVLPLALATRRLEIRANCRASASLPTTAGRRRVSSIGRRAACASSQLGSSCWRATPLKTCACCCCRAVPDAPGAWATARDR
jgi:gluconate 2-dehydrogenase alpha chain